MGILHAGSTCCIEAPAKLNLFLEVLGKRDDGFHEIETLMAAISIRDSLYFQATQHGPIHLTCKWASGMEANQVVHGIDVVSALGEIPSGQGNLVWKALERFRQFAGITAGARVRLVKRIPAAAGLGGASSDAAAALLAANRLWNVGWSRNDLGQLAAEIGSDVPFFLVPRATMAIGRGRGEQLEPTRVGLRIPAVVVRPPEGLSTAEVYGGCQPTTRPVPLQPLLDALAEGRLAAVAQRLFNRLEPAALELSPRIRQLRRQFAQLDLLGFGMSGSGSSFFGICRHAKQARRVAATLRAAGAGHVFAVTTVPLLCGPAGSA